MSTAMTPVLVAQLQALLASPRISANAVSNFLVVVNAVTGGVDVTFTLTDATGVATVSLVRNFVMDQGTATVIQTWAASAAGYSWADTDSGLAAQGQAFYWLVLAPQGSTGTAVNVGPQNIVLNPDLLPPVEPTEISASSGAIVNGTVKITANVDGIGAAVKIYVSGYHGSAAEVAVATSISSPLQFVLDATGETVTLEAIGVSAGGTETAAGPITTITLDGTPTVPAKVQGVEVTQIAAGNQVTWPQSLDATPTYQLYRAQSGQDFSQATLLATVTGTAASLDYLDTGGLGGNWEYFVTAVNGSGTSLPSDPATPAVLFTSASVPENVPSNTTNTATVDSIDAGTSATARIYGPGGVGTDYYRLTGYGNLDRPSGTVAGLAYATVYCVVWTGTAYLAVTTYPETLQDGYELVGAVTTVAMGGGGGVSGGGGDNGGIGGSPAGARAGLV